MTGGWEIGLIVAASVLVTATAYLRSPLWKMFVMYLPLPFTFAVIIVGKPVDATNVIGLALLYVYAVAVRVLHHKFRIPIIPSITVSAGLYCLVAFFSRPIIPGNDAAFWCSVLLLVVFCLALMLVTVPHNEPEYRTPLPLWMKLPIIVGIILALVLAKKWLGGFMTTFPIVMLAGTYEVRKSLHALTDRFPMLVLLVLSLGIISRVTFASVGLKPSLVLGWIVCLIELIVLFVWTKSRVAAIQTRLET